AADRAQLPFGQPDEVAALKADPSRGNPRRALRQESEHRQGADALAGARLADKAQRLASVDVGREPADGPNRALPRAELHVQVLDFEQRCVHRVPFGSTASRRPSPTKFTATTVSTMATLAGTQIHGRLMSTTGDCAALTICPQLEVGGRTPSPRK